MDMNRPDAVNDRPPPPRTLGVILAEAGRLDALQTGRVLLWQAQHGIRFGEAARELGILDDEDILFGLASQFEYAHLRPGDNLVSPEVMAAFGSRQPVIEAMRDLRSRLMLHWLRKKTGRKSLALVSARHGEGKSFIAANLAVLFSQLGQRTLLVDADLIHPSQHQLFRLDNRLGLSSALSGLAWLETAVAIPRLTGLVVLPAGPRPPNPRELISRPRLGSLLAQAGQAFDVVVIDTPSAGTTADAPLVAAHATASLLVCRPNAATLDETATLTSALGNLLGAVVNQF